MFLKQTIPEKFKGNMDNWIFGCDVCPWNSYAKPHQEKSFYPKKELMAFREKDWEELTLETFNRVFKKSAIKRTKFKGLKRNINFLKKV